MPFFLRGVGGRAPVTAACVPIPEKARHFDTS